MGKLVRCKVCGYIMEEGKLGDVCPACGALSKVFEPYEDPISERRRRILKMDLHPIAVHFSVAFAASLVVITIVSSVAKGRVEELFTATTKIMTFFTPIMVLASFLTGLVDGKIRFRRLDRSPILKRKIVLGIVLFLSTIGLAFIVWIGEFAGLIYSLLSIAVALVSLVCAFLLALWGSSIKDSAFAGK